MARDLFSPDEVRKMDNDKCIIFVKGYDPVVDDKYKTYLKDEFKNANLLGPYRHRKLGQIQELEESSQMYLDAPEDPMKSYRYQIEACQGIFEESGVFRDVKEYNDEIIYLDPEKYPGYLKRNESGELIPAYHRYRKESVKTGGEIIHRHSIIGYIREDVFYDLNMETVMGIFTPGSRYSLKRRSSINYAT